MLVGPDEGVESGVGAAQQLQMAKPDPLGHPEPFIRQCGEEGMCREGVSAVVEPDFVFTRAHRPEADGVLLQTDASSIPCDGRVVLGRIVDELDGGDEVEREDVPGGGVCCGWGAEGEEVATDECATEGDIAAREEEERVEQSLVGEKSENGHG